MAAWEQFWDAVELRWLDWKHPLYLVTTCECGKPFSIRVPRVGGVKEWNCECGVRRLLRWTGVRVAVEVLNPERLEEVNALARRARATRRSSGS